MLIESNFNKIDNFTIAIQLSAGGQNIDFQSVVMKYIDNQTSDTMNYSANLTGPRLIQVLTILKSAL